jgi:hypothetical protein
VAVEVTFGNLEALEPEALEAEELDLVLAQEHQERVGQELLI